MNESADRQKSTSRVRLDVAAVAATILISCVFTLGVLWRMAQRNQAYAAFDIYRADYQNLIYTLRSVQRGYGLLWNPLQNCGQPFLPSTLLGLPYPLHAIFFVFDVDTSLFVTAALHLAIAGSGAYFLARQMRLSRVAALCGAIAFELGGSTLNIATWVPTTILGIYVWIPTTLLLCERILELPTLVRGVLLGLVLTLQLLAGYPQLLLFAYQMIALRVAWELLTRRPPQWPRLLGVLAVAGTLPVLLGAVQLFPMLEYMWESVRRGPLTMEEMNPGGWFSWSKFRASTGAHSTAGMGTTFAVVPAALAGAALASSNQRRLAVVYFLALALFMALAFETPLLEVYRQLPVVSAFRLPCRFLWLAGFAFSVIAAIGVDRVTGAGNYDGAARFAPIAGATLGVLAFYLLSATNLPWWDWALGGFTVGVCTLAAGWPAGRVVARSALPAVLLLNLLVIHWRPEQGLLRNGGVLYAKKDAFAFLTEHMTPQDRIYQVGQFNDLSIQSKTPTIFETPSITDYEPQTSRRYAEVYVLMVNGAEMKHLNQFYFQFQRIPKNRRLLNLLATRYVVVGDIPPHELKVLGNPPLTPVWEMRNGSKERSVWEGEWVRIYENPAALPRAFYVARAQVMKSRSALLHQLAFGRDDPRRVALLEEEPADGFRGATESTSGDARIVLDRSEELVIRVSAAAAGFLFVSDQYYPGWRATVNGVETPILRANHAFRLVRVPAGESTVVFRYRPLTVWLGVAMSMISLGGMTAYLGIVARRHRARKRVGGLTS